MRRGAGMLFTGVVVAVATAWVLDVVPDARTARSVAVAGARAAQTVLADHYVLLIVLGIALFVLLLGSALLVRARLGEGLLADRIALTAVGVALVLGAMALLNGGEALIAAAFGLAGFGLGIVSVVEIVRYLRVRATVW